jgi:zinc transporter 1/2/3
MTQVRDSFDKVIKSGEFPALEQFPFAEGIVILGFFAVYLFEELGELLMGHGKKKKKTKKTNGAGSSTLNGQIPVKTVTSDTEDDHHKLTIMTVSNNEDKNNGTRRDDTDNDSDHSSHEDGHHGHSHGPPPNILSELEQRSVAAAIRGFLLVFALSFHSIFEGMAIGLQSTLKDIWFLFAAVTVHELAIMFCIGMEMLASHIRVGIYIAYMVTLGLITPIGVAIGIFVTEYFQDPTPFHTLIIGILQGVAAGTLLYVTFLEVLERERRKSGNGLIKLLSVFVGFILLSALEALGG